MAAGQRAPRATTAVDGSSNSVAAPAIARADAWLLVHPDLQRVARVRAVFDALVDLARADAATVGSG